MITTVQNFLLHHKHAGKPPVSTFFNRDWLGYKIIFIFYNFFWWGGREGVRILSLQGSDDRKYRNIPKLSPGAFIFQRPFLRGLFLEALIFEGAYVRREICVSK